jgi:orotidine-5'-phosphate decarboxylase
VSAEPPVATATNGAGQSPDPAAGRAVQGVARAFGDRLAELVAQRGSQLVLGLDLAGGPGDPPSPPAQRAALAVAIHCTMAIEAAGEHCVAVKPQVACFERLGAPGWAALAEVAQRARERGLLVIADAKRGDIDVSAAAYAQAFFGGTSTPFGSVPGLGADALTANPLLGMDSLAPLVTGARESGGGLFVLVRTSNPGAEDVQELTLATGEKVSDRLAALVARLAPPSHGEPGTDGISDVGAVVGATAPEWLERLRAAMPSAPFLLPGIGAQGGRVEDLAAAFAPGPAGGLVTASRGIVNAYEKHGGDPAGAAAEAAARLRELAWKIAA